MKRFFLLLLVLLFGTAVLFAETYTVERYEINNTGKTHDFAIKNLIVPSGNEVYESESVLSKAVAEKEQILVNKRVFKSVGVTWKEISRTESNVTVAIVVALDEGKSILGIPYFKYDTNYGVTDVGGLRVGGRVWDSNLLGTMADMESTFNVTVADNEWTNPSVIADVKINNLLLGSETKMNIVAEAEGTKNDLHSYRVGVDTSKIPLGKYRMTLNLGAKSYKAGNHFNVYSSIQGLKIGSVSLTPSAGLYVYDKNSGAVSSSYFTASLATGGVKFGNVKLSFSDSTTFKQNKKVGDEYSYQPYSFTHTTNVGFSWEKLSKFSYSNGLTYYPNLAPNPATVSTFDGHAESTPCKYSFVDNNTLSYRLSDTTTLLFLSELYLSKEGELQIIDNGVGVSQKMKITERFSITPTAKQYLRYDFNSELFSRYYTLSAAASGDYVNWVGNFRKGYSYNISLSESWWQSYTSRIAKSGAVRDHAEVSIYSIPASWLNTSARVLVNYANNGNYQYVTYSKSTEFGEYLRGVRNKTLEDYKQNVFASVINLNVTSKFPMPSMFDWVDCYANVFFDYANIKHKVGKEIAKNFYGIGIEGIGILKEYPSYPIRVSLGFDLERLIERFKRENDRSFTETYEIYIGMGFFF